MEAIITKQQSIIKSFELENINFKKDSPSRKTPEYIVKKLQKLDQLWIDFQFNHEQLLSFDDKSHEYFGKNMYKQVQEYFQGTRELIENFQVSKPGASKMDVGEYSGDTSQKTKQSGEDLVQMTKLKSLMNQQHTNFKAFLRQIQYCDVDGIEEKWELEDELRSIQGRWDCIDKLHWQIDNLLEESDPGYEDEYNAQEMRYREIKRALNRKLLSTTHQKDSTPRMDIPIFTGNYAEWPTFLDLYRETIHQNPTISKSQKMQHLKSKIKGDAERLIHHLHISADNYDTAWEILCQRYNNKQLLFTKQIEVFLNQPSIQKQTSYEIRKIHDISKECLHAIQNLGVDTTTWGPLLVHLLSKKLDSDTYRDYQEARKNPRELAKIEDLFAFLELKFTALEPIRKMEELTLPKFAKSLTKFDKKSPNVPQKYTSNRAYYTNFKRDKCILCNIDHALYECKRFASMSSEGKLSCIAKHNICQNCLYRHEKGICNSDKRCKMCNKAHNSLLHEAFNDRVTSSASNGSSSRSSSKNANHVDSENNEMLLTTVQIRVRARDGAYVTVRCLLDQGSQITLITERLAQLLGLQRQHVNASVCGVGVAPKKGKGKITLNCKSIYDEYEFETEALIMTKVINNLPNSSFDKKTFTHLQNIQLADPEYHISRPIDILLDVKVYSEIIMNGLLRGSPQQPIAQQTKLGWILSGNIFCSKFNCHVVVNNEEDISRFWEIEEIAEKSALTEREQWCENLYVSTTRRLSNGRYEVRMPMIENFEQHLGPSKPKAVAQLKHLESRLAKDSKLHDSYHHFMEEYIALGHMKKCDKRKDPSCFLPHHDIHKLDSTTTKLRVVFNASSKTKSGYSLNDLMECGPKLHNDIQGLLINWRTFRYVYAADCEKMYRMIMVHEDDQHLQKIVWRCVDIIQEFQLCTLTYGTKAAPFLALRTLRKIAEDEREQYPLAAKVLLNNVYVDDILAGHNDIDTAKKTQTQLIDMLKGAGMNLRKWSSNAPELLEHLEKDQLNQINIEFKSSNSTKTLGLKWEPKTDSFKFENKIDYATSINHSYTKRMMLSDISKLFDPLGWLSPVTIKAKLLFQKVWNTGIGWDDIIPDDIRQEWMKLREDLKNIDKFDIPRWIGNNDKTIELHGFSDASEKAMACCVYVKTTDDKGNTTLTLLAAKTKLAPAKKPVTLPRLELCAATLLTKLLDKIKASLPDNMTVDFFGWTDSMVVLGWLQGDASRWKAFVANRVRQILDILPASCWRHVKSECNAADCATRGLHPSQLLDNQMWWTGPSWLKDDIQRNTQKIEIPTLEVNSVKSSCAVQVIPSSIIIDLLNKNSKMTRVVRIICWISRFTRRTSHNNNKTISEHLTACEMRAARNMIIKHVQAQHFSDTIVKLKGNDKISTKSSLLTLNPFLDNDGILRVGGRLEHSKLSYTSKHPIILPHDSHLTRLLIEEAHQATLHGGATLTLAYTRYHYWIISGNRAVKKWIRQCVKCRRHNPQSPQQIMAQLPEPRVTPSRPFTHTGVDFTGFVDIKANKGRGTKILKGYIAVFVCFSTKAIHLELVTDLSSASFLAAFSRMCGRRGVPQHVYSDNGTNFVGASRILNTQYKEALSVINTEFMDDVSSMGVTWHFNAPAWPSAGGLWEAAVKSVKHHLKRVIGEQKLTFDEFYTLLTQVEACVNSRPLYALTENIEDDVLTPGHFLVGGPLLSAPLGTLDEPSHPHTRWQLTEKMYKSFWKKWSTEYLHRLQIRSKWNQIKPNLNINDIVLVNEDNMPPSKWALGKVIDVHSGKDGNVRVVTLKTRNGVLKRPIIKLTPLPVHLDRDIVPPETKENDNDKHPTQNKKRNTRIRKKPNFYVAVLMLLMTFITPSVQDNYQITGIKTNNTLYFDKIADMRLVQDQWTMVVYYNMTKYWQSMADIQNYMKHLKAICSDEMTYKPILSQFEHELNEINYYNELLQAKNTIRRKRGFINGVGNIANTLFGVLDDKFAEKYENDIITIRTNENHLLRMLKNQTSILEAQNNILKRNEAVMNDHFQYINEHLKNVSLAINQIEKTNAHQLQVFYIMSTALSADVILSNLRRIQETLIDTITNIHHGQLDIHLISPSELQDQLNIISGQLQGELVLPAHSGRDLYQLLQVHARVTRTFLIMEIKIPLLSVYQFELSKIVSLPWKKNNKYMYNIPTTPYIAVNVKKDMVIPMNDNDMQTCIKYQDDKLICYESVPILNVHFEKSICTLQLYNSANDTFCRSEIRPCSDKWIKLQAPGAWLYSCCRECRVRILCPTGHETKHLHGNGLIHISHGCLIKGDTFTIQSHHDYTNVMVLERGIDVPKILQPTSTLNDMINSSYSYHFKEVDTEQHDQLYESIRQQLDNLKTQELKQIQTSGTTHYTIIYSILSPIVMLLLIYIIVKLRRRCFSSHAISSRCSGTQDHPGDLRLDRALNSVVSAVNHGVASAINDNDNAINARHRTMSICPEVNGSTVSVDRATSPSMSRTIKFDNLPNP